MKQSMTASERAEVWREIAECVDTPGNALGLCYRSWAAGLYTGDEAYGYHSEKALHFRFMPTTTESYWWPFTPEGNQERATAACFLAAMEEIGYE